MTSDHQNESWLALILATLAWGVLLWMTHVGFNTHPPSYDFSENFYISGKMLLTGHRFFLYDLGVQRALQERFLHSIGVVFCYPAPVALIYVIPATLSVTGAHLLWSVTSCLIFALSASVMHRALGLRHHWAYFFLFIALFTPVYVHLIQGQIDVLLLLIFAVAYRSLCQQKDLHSGLYLALGLLKFQVILPFVFILLLRRQWRVLAGFFVGSVGFLLAWIGISGPHSLIAYRNLLATINTIPGALVAPDMMANLRGMYFAFAHREMNIIILACVTLALLGWASLKWKELEAGYWLAVTVSLLASYHANPHSLVLLIGPLAVIWKRISIQGWLSLSGIAFSMLALPFVPLFAIWHRNFAYLAWPVLLSAWALAQPLTNLPLSDLTPERE